MRLTPGSACTLRHLLFQVMQHFCLMWLSCVVAKHNVVVISKVLHTAFM